MQTSLCFIGKRVKGTLEMKVSIISLLLINRLVTIGDEDPLREFLKYDGIYDLAVCLDCGHGLPLEWIVKHFKDVHKIIVRPHIICPNDNSSQKKEPNGWTNG
jgi:hypothetical protein